MDERDGSTGPRRYEKRSAPSGLRWLLPSLAALTVAGLALSVRGPGDAFAQPGTASASASASSKPAWVWPKSSASAKTSASASAAPTESAPPAKTQEPNPGDPTVDVKANADSLFDRGKELLEKGQFEEACPLLSESLRLDFALGTLLYLSDCQEQIGQTASAWSGFKKAEAIAKKRNEAEREQKAHARVVVLEAKLSMLTISVAEENKSIGVVVKRNGVEVGAPAWGQSLPVDPGEQKIEATAPGYKPWSTTIDVPKGRGETSASVPPLEKAPEVDKPSNGLTLDGRAMRISGLALGGAGLLGLALGTGFGIDAIKTYDDAIGTCENGDPTQCTADGVQLQHDASRSAVISTVTFTLGAVFLAGGTALFFLAPKSAAKAPKVGAYLDDKNFFLTIGGAL